MSGANPRIASNRDLERNSNSSFWSAGLTPDPDMPGFDVYERPSGKSGGHGIGWSEIPQYQFRVPETWGEVPVSIADLGGTEIDLRFKCRDEGDLSVVVAPVLRFRHVFSRSSASIQILEAPPSQWHMQLPASTLPTLQCRVILTLSLQGRRVQRQCHNGVLGITRQNHRRVWA